MGSEGGLAGGGVRSRGRWSDAAVWTGEDLRREVLFFDSGGARLYGSVYAAASRPSLGVLFCNSWGVEGDLASRLVHRASAAVARAGGVAASFHYPGFGDSDGDPGEATVEDLAQAAVAAAEEAGRRHPDVAWILAGLMFGAPVACLAAERAAVSELLLVQPALRPSRYLARLERASKRALGGPSSSPGFAFGYPLPERMLAAAPEADAAVTAALARFDGAGTAIECEAPVAAEGPPVGFERVVAPSRWRFGAEQNRELAATGTRWLVRRVEAAA